MIQLSQKSINGTSYWGTNIVTTKKQLKELFPKYETNWDRMAILFILENEGDVFTIYEKTYEGWDYGAHDEAQIEFHIGGKSKEITEKAKWEVEKRLEEVRLSKNISDSDKRFILGCPKEIKLDTLKSALDKGEFGIFLGLSKILLEAPITEGGISSDEIHAIYIEQNIK